MLLEEEDTVVEKHPTDCLFCACYVVQFLVSYRWCLIANRPALV